EVRSGGSYYSQNDLRVHFGLGKARRLKSLEIRWPSGQTEIINDIAANQFIVVKEGTGLVRTASPGKK
ncbi:MAG TPA: ASPIC/UnbV domain-containing protein, partial [Blastocatellia bacterium]|nr:ASPIC/UnbV domain-containing protein [Blastocatellia bacterium]